MMGIVGTYPAPPPRNVDELITDLMKITEEKLTREPTIPKRDYPIWDEDL